MHLPMMDWNPGNRQDRKILLSGTNGLVSHVRLCIVQIEIFSWSETSNRTIALVQFYLTQCHTGVYYIIWYPCPGEL